MIKEENEMRGTSRGRDRSRGYRGYTRKRTCEECRKYSRKTYDCANLGKVLEKKTPACNFFSPRKRTRPRGRKYY